MIIDKNIYEKGKLEAGDLLVTDDGFVFMIVRDDDTGYYKLLRLRDGNIPKREVFEYSIARTAYRTIEDLLEDDNIKRYKIISNKLLKLELI